MEIKIPKLGKLAAKEDPRNLKFAHYLPKKLPASPDRVAWQKVKKADSWGMDGNDKYGNCVIVTAAHIIDCAKANDAKRMERISDKRVINLSTKMGALDGYVVLDRLKWWKNIGMFKTKIRAFTQVDVKANLVKAAIHIFGHCDIGIQMPRAWQGRMTWDTGVGWEYEKSSWGGHSVPILGYSTNPAGDTLFYLCSWGSIYVLTERALTRYCDEAYVSILPAWYNRDRLTPSGFKLKELEEDLKQI